MKTGKKLLKGRFTFIFIDNAAAHNQIRIAGEHFVFFNKFTLAATWKFHLNNTFCNLWRNKC